MRKSKYKFLSHTADLRLEIYGETLEELFINAANALARILYEQGESAKFSVPPKAGGPSMETIKVESLNKNALLVDFINEILAKSHINKKVYKVHKVIKLKDREVKAELVGYPVEKFDEDIKAVTYHEVDIQQKDGIWQTKLVIDI